MWANLWDDLSSRGAIALMALVLGSAMTWLVARWKRHQEHLSILRGDARDTVVIHQHLIEMVDVPNADGSGTHGVPQSLRIRTLGQAELNRVVPNGHLAAVLLHRAFHVTRNDTLISMHDAEGSYLLETLTNFVCDRAGNEPFEHDLYVMAPCCEPAELSQHQPLTILLIAAKDLAVFETWSSCRNIQVEHGSDGARVLTLMDMARRFRTEQETITGLRKAGQRTRYVETMYILDLALDKRAAPFPLRDVPWGRFEDVLRLKNLE